MKRVTHFELVVRVPFPCVGLGGLPPLAPEPHVAMATRRTQAASNIWRTGTFVVPRELAVEVPALADRASEWVGKGGRPEAATRRNRECPSGSCKPQLASQLAGGSPTGHADAAGGRADGYGGGAVRGHATSLQLSLGPGGPVSILNISKLGQPRRLPIAGHVYHRIRAERTHQTANDPFGQSAARRPNLSSRSRVRAAWGASSRGNEHGRLSSPLSDERKFTEPTVRKKTVISRLRGSCKRRC